MPVERVARKAKLSTRQGTQAKKDPTQVTELAIQKFTLSNEAGKNDETSRSANTARLSRVNTHAYITELKETRIKKSRRRIQKLNQMIKRNKEYESILQKYEEDPPEETRARLKRKQTHVINRFSKLQTHYDRMKVSKLEAHKEATELLATIQERGGVLHDLVKIAENVKEGLKKQEPVEKMKESARVFDKRLNTLNNKIARIQLQTSHDLKATQTLNRVFNEFEVTNHDRFKDIDMMDSFGVELDDVRWNEFMHASGYNSRYDEITARMFREYVEEQLGMSAKEAQFFLKDQQMVKRVNSKQCQTLCSNLLFALCLILIIIMLYRNLQTHSTPDRYMATRGVEQVLVGSVWMDITFEDINSVGLFYQYCKLILLPFAYGILEFQFDGGAPQSVDQLTSLYPNSTEKMDPYLLGGIHMRQIRFKPKPCTYESSIFPWIGSTECVDEVDDQSDIYSFVNTTHINRVLPWRSPKQNKDLLPTPGWTKTVIDGSGTVLEFPAHTTGDPCGKDYSCEYCVDGEYVPEEYTEKSMLPWQLCKAYNMLEELELGAYIDKMTRVIVIDFNSFDQTKSLHTLGRLKFEFRLGTVWPSYNIHTHNFLYYTQPEAVNFLAVFSIVVFIFSLMHFGEVFTYIQILGGPMWSKVTSENRKLSSLNIQILRFIVSERSFKHEWWRMCCGKKHKHQLAEEERIKFMHYDEKTHLLTIPLLNCTQLQIQKNQTIIVSTVKETLESPQISDGYKSVSFHHIRTTDYGVVNFVLLVTDVDYDEEDEDDTLTESEEEGSTGFLVAEPMQIESIVKQQISIESHPEVELKRLSSLEHVGIRGLTYHTSSEKMFEKIGEDLAVVLHQDNTLRNCVVVVPSDPSLLQRTFGLGLLTHYSDFFRWVDLFLIVILISICIIQACIIDNIKDELDKNTLFMNTKYHSFRNLLSLVYIEETLLFAFMMFTTIKVMDFASAYLNHFNMFKNMLLNVALTVLHFFLLLLWVVFIFGTIGWILFSSQLRDFRTINSSFLYLFRSFVSEIDFEAITNAHPLALGYVYYFFWIIIITFILVNVFVGIMLTEWERTVQDSEIQIEHENFSSMLTRLFPKAHKYMSKDKMTDVGLNKFKEKKYWVEAYPAGCPKRKLRMYLVSQIGVDEDDVDLVMDLIDRDESGTIDWDELTSILLDIKPTIDARMFALRRKELEAIQDSNRNLLDEIKAQNNKLRDSIQGQQTKYPATYKHLDMDQRKAVDKIIDAYREHPRYEQVFFEEKTKEKIMAEIVQIVKIEPGDALEIIESISIPTTEYVSNEMEALKAEVKDIRSDVREIKEMLTQMQKGWFRR